MRITDCSWESQTEFGNYIQQASLNFLSQDWLLWNLLPYLLYSQQQKRDFLLQKHVSNTVSGRPNEFDNPKSRVVRRTFWLMKVVPTWKKFEKRRCNVSLGIWIAKFVWCHMIWHDLVDLKGFLRNLFWRISRWHLAIHSGEPEENHETIRGPNLKETHLK